MASSGPCCRTGETQTVFGQCIKVRRLDIAPVAAQVGISQVVGQDEDDVGRLSRRLVGGVQIECRDQLQQSEKSDQFDVHVRCTCRR